MEIRKPQIKGNPLDKDAVKKMQAAVLSDKEEKAEIPKTMITPKEEPKMEVAVLSDKEDKGILDNKAPGAKTYTPEEILPIMDSLLQNGYAIMGFKIKNIEIVLRTRFTWEEQYIYKHMEKMKLETALSYQREFAVALIAASLARYGTYEFPLLNHGSEEDLNKNFMERYEFVTSLNNVITDIIQKKLYDFDDKQRYLIANFDELMQDF